MIGFDSDNPDESTYYFRIMVVLIITLPMVPNLPALKRSTFIRRSGLVDSNSLIVCVTPCLDTQQLSIMAQLYQASIIHSRSQ